MSSPSPLSVLFVYYVCIINHENTFKYTKKPYILYGYSMHIRLSRNDKDLNDESHVQWLLQSPC